MISKQLFTDRWPIVPLGDAVEFLDHLRKPVTQSQRTEGEYPYYGANGLQGTIDDYIFDEPLVLLAEDGGHFGSKTKTVAYSIDGKTWVNNHAHVLRPKACADRAYISRLLENYDVTPFTSGSTRAKLTKGKAELIPIPLPPLAEQKRIAAILDKADAIRRKRQQALQLADDFLRSVFLDMFGDPVTNPKNFEKLPLEKTAEVLTGFAFPSKKFQEPGEGVRLCRGVNVLPGRLDWRDRQDWDITEASELRKFELRERDVILALDRPWISSGLKVAMVEQEELPALLVQRVARIRGESKFSQAYLYQCILHNGFERHCRPTETTIPHISPVELREFEVLSPPADDINRFEKVAAHLSGSVASLVTALDCSEDTFHSLQQRAFRGEL